MALSSFFVGSRCKMTYVSKHSWSQVQNLINRSELVMLKKVANNLDKQSFPKLFSWGEVKGRWAESGAAAYERSQDVEAQLAKARGAKNCPTHLKGLDDGVKFPWGQNVLIFGQHWPLRRKGGQSNHPALRLMPLLPKRCRMLLAGWSKSFKHTWNEMKQTFQL